MEVLMNTARRRHDAFRLSRKRKWLQSIINGAVIDSCNFFKRHCSRKYNRFADTINDHKKQEQHYKNRWREIFRLEKKMSGKIFREYQDECE